MSIEADFRTHNAPKVAFFIPDLGGGGTQKVVVTLANELAARGYTVDMVLVQASGLYRRSLSEAVEVVDLRAANTYFSLLALVSYLRTQRPRYLVSSLDLTNLFALIARAIARTDIRVIIRIEHMLSALQRVFWKKRLEKVLLTTLYPHADEIIAVSRAVAEDAARYIGIPESRVQTIYNPVITPLLHDPSVEVPAHPWFDTGSPPVVLGIGRLTRVKDFATLLRAFALVRQKRMTRLLIFGEGEERDRLEKLARELGVEQDVDLPGFVENSFSYLRGATAFVLSSLYEGLPTVLIEALASGCPVISTDCPGGAREILANGKYGDLVPVGDPDAMAEAICRILDGKIHPTDQEWLEQFELNHVVDQTLKMLGLPEKLEMHKVF